MNETTHEASISTTPLPPNGSSGTGRGTSHTILLDLDTFRGHLARLASASGGKAGLGRRLGVTGQFIDLLIDGKRKPGPKILKAIGARRKVMIEIDVEAEWWGLVI
jgi:hypothetical protein